MPARWCVWIAPSEGTTCEGCGQLIPAGKIEYQIVVGGREMRVDAACFRRRVEDLRGLENGSA